MTLISTGAVMTSTTFNAQLDRALSVGQHCPSRCAELLLCVAVGRRSGQMRKNASCERPRRAPVRTARADLVVGQLRGSAGTVIHAQTQRIHCKAAMSDGRARPYISIYIPWQWHTPLRPRRSLLPSISLPPPLRCATRAQTTSRSCTRMRTRHLGARRPARLCREHAVPCPAAVARDPLTLSTIRYRTPLCGPCPALSSPSPNNTNIAPAVNLPHAPVKHTSRFVQKRIVPSPPQLTSRSASKITLSEGLVSWGRDGAIHFWDREGDGTAGRCSGCAREGAYIRSLRAGCWRCPAGGTPLIRQSRKRAGFT